MTIGIIVLLFPQIELSNSVCFGCASSPRVRDVRSALSCVQSTQGLASHMARECLVTGTSVLRSIKSLVKHGRQHRQLFFCRPTTQTGTRIEYLCTICLHKCLQGYDLPFKRDDRQYSVQFLVHWNSSWCYLSLLEVL